MPGDTPALTNKEAKRLIDRVLQEHERAELERDRLEGCNDFDGVWCVLVEAGVPAEDVDRVLAQEKRAHARRLRARRRRPWIIAAVLIVVSVVGIYAARWVVPRYDVLVADREDVRREWAQVDALLQRRYDLIPNLVQTVGGYAGHEAGVLTDVAAAHSGYLSARGTTAKLKASYAAERGIRGCAMLALRYPALKADGAFLRLMDELTDAEEKITAQRLAYNEAVADLNAQLQTVEGRLVAMVTDLELAAYYDPPEQTESLPLVHFDDSRAQTVPAPVAAPPSEPSVSPRPRPEQSALAPAPPVAAAPEPAPEPEAQQSPPDPTEPLRRLVVVSVDTRRRRATLRFPGGATKALAQGDRVPGFDARVVGVNAAAVLIEARVLDALGRTVRRTVRLEPAD